jgi:hypothetical protein
MDTEIRAQRVELIIENGDEMKRYVENLSEINNIRDKNHLTALYACAKEERRDLTTGKVFSILAVYRMGLDPENPMRPVLFQEVVPVNEAGEILQETKQVTKMASAVFTSGQVEHYQKIRGMKLKASTMNATAGKFEFSE